MLERIYAFMDVKDLVDMNPWWDIGDVPLKLRKKSSREIYDELVELMETRQIVSLVGLRRTGKSTLMYQLIHHLISSGVPARNIFYFSFDIAFEGLKELINTYFDTVPGAGEGRTYVFLDEIQKLNDWTNKIKILYDSNPDNKFVISGSASLEIAQKGGESLAGRILKIRLAPLEFREYLSFSNDQGRLEGNDLEDIYKRYRIHERVYLQTFKDAVLRGGLIETIDMRPNTLKYYMNSSIIDNVLLKDIPNRYTIENPAMLREIVRAISLNPGMLINFDRLASSFNISRQTMSKYFAYLEDSFLIHTAYNYSGSFIASARKLKKAYLAHPSIAMAFIEDDVPPDLLGRYVENYLLVHGKNEFFYRRNNNEIDMVQRYGRKPIPIEIKYTSDVGNRTLKVVNSFVKRYKSPFGIVLTREIFERKGNILLIPNPLFLLLNNPLEIIHDYMGNSVQRGD